MLFRKSLPQEGAIFLFKPSLVRSLAQNWVMGFKSLLTSIILQESRRWWIRAQERCLHKPPFFLRKSHYVSMDRQATNIKKVPWVQTLLLERTSDPSWQVGFCHSFGRDGNGNPSPSLLQACFLKIESLSFLFFKETQVNLIPFDSSSYLPPVVWRKDQIHTKTVACVWLNAVLLMQTAWLLNPDSFHVQVLKPFCTFFLKAPKMPQADVTLLIQGEHLHGQQVQNPCYGMSSWASLCLRPAVYGHM